MAQILIAEEIRDLIEPDLLAEHSVEWMGRGRKTPSGGYEALVPLLDRTIGPSELAGLPQLKVVANCAVGVDNLDLDAIRGRGVIATHTPNVLTDATADLAWTLILGVARRVKEGQALLEEGWSGWHPTQLLGVELSGRTLGIVGAGRIGQAVGRRALGFGMRIGYCSRTPKPEFERETGAVMMELDQLLVQSDVVSIHTPLGESTKHLIDEKRIGLMKKRAILVNTARGGVVDESALIRALDRGLLFGAGLDVFEGEPDVRREILAHPSILSLPHLGSATERTRRAMAGLAIENVSAVLRGDPPPTPVGR